MVSNVEIIVSASDELFAQLRRCPIDSGELDRVLKGLDLANIEEVYAVIGASELTLRDPEELADALLKYGFPVDIIIEILADLKEQEIELRKVFSYCSTFDKLEVDGEKKEDGKDYQRGVDEEEISLRGNKFRDDNVGFGDN